MYTYMYAWTKHIIDQVTAWFNYIQHIICPDQSLGGESTVQFNTPQTWNPTHTCSFDKLTWSACLVPEWMFLGKVYHRISLPPSHAPVGEQVYAQSANVLNNNPLHNSVSAQMSMTNKPSSTTPTIIYYLYKSKLNYDIVLSWNGCNFNSRKVVIIWHDWH